MEQKRRYVGLALIQPSENERPINPTVVLYFDILENSVRGKITINVATKISGGIYGSEQTDSRQLDLTAQEGEQVLTFQVASKQPNPVLPKCTFDYTVKLTVVQMDPDSVLLVYAEASAKMYLNNADNTLIAQGYSSAYVGYKNEPTL
jgi:hypothetical protein